MSNRSFFDDAVALINMGCTSIDAKTVRGLLTIIENLDPDHSKMKAMGHVLIGDISQPYITERVLEHIPEEDDFDYGTETLAGCDISAEEMSKYEEEGIDANSLATR